MNMNNKLTAVLTIGLLLLTGCSLSGSTPPTPTALVIPTFISTNTATPPEVTAPGSTPLPNTSTFCADPQVLALIDTLKSAVLKSDGVLLSSLVHPTKGVEVRWVRNGNAITYTPEQAKFLFETTFEANWGPEPGSGQDKIGSFHDVIIPELAKIFNQSPTLHCKDLKHGGATYELTWPYQGDFYSVFFPGTDQYGFLDWRTWAIGIEYVNAKPFMYALMQFFWEP